jgi:hypothetical protein
MRMWLEILIVCLFSGWLSPECSIHEYRDRWDPALAVYADPGAGAWETVAPEDLIEVCGLDPDILAEIDDRTSYPYAIVRYGVLCHEHYPEGSPGPGEIAENYSATKTLGAAIVGRAVKMSARLPRPLSDEDRMDAWVEDITFNPDALVAHVLAMVGHSDDLAYGQRTFEYDTIGDVQINRLSDVVEEVIAQDPDLFGGVTTTGEFADRYLFEPLGMFESSWSGENFAFSWGSSLRDMARLGLLLLHDGVWNQRRLIDEDWVYKMTHPAFEDTNTGYGYLTWLAASSNYKFPGIDVFMPGPYGSCQPSALWPSYPHTPSEASDCGYGGVYPCDQEYDIGAFAAAGYGGQLIVGHPGLDLVIVTKDAGILAFVTSPWDLIRSALIEHDPTYAGDDAAFCAAYAAGGYAPDLIAAP